MHVEFIVEEPSVEAALHCLAPKILDPGVTLAIHSHQGKPDLLAKLPGRLKGYRRWLPSDWRIVVLVDADEGDCRVLKSRLERYAREAGLMTKTAASGSRRFYVLNRLAVRELEAWFFGDVDALRQAYPRMPCDLANKASFRDPDAIAGGTWEALERELQRRGYHLGGLAKISAAREIAVHMVPEHNRSRSFQTFRRGLLGLVG